jgi:uncharacterized protein (TIGR03435 family)
MSTKVIVAALLCWIAPAQTPKPDFEVASVKPATPLGPIGLRSDRKGGPGTSDPGLYTCRNCPLAWVLYEAYDLKTYEFQGPDWLANTRFDFEARIPAGTTKPVFQQMLQNLLADRFKLAVHREQKAMEVYEMTVAKNGPKFKESTPAAPAAAAADGPGQIKRDAEGFPILGPKMMMAVVPGHARLRSDSQTMSWLADQLSAQLGGPVTDATALKGKYDFILSWAFGEETAAVVPGEAGAPHVDAYRPALINAVQAQLGLKMDRKKAPVEVLIVDHADKSPTAN